jgi:hypothetical protein
MQTRLPLPSMLARIGRRPESTRPLSAATSHTRAVASSLAKRRRLPSGENARAVMLPRLALPGAKVGVWQALSTRSSSECVSGDQY